MATFKDRDVFEFCEKLFEKLKKQDNGYFPHRHDKQVFDIILCAFPFLSRIITLPGLCSFFPDQLLEIYLDIKEAGLVTLGGKVTTIATVIVPVYAVICLILLPILYKVYKKTEIK